MIKIELRETFSEVENPGYDSRTKYASKHGLKTVRKFATKTRFQYIKYPRGGGQISVINPLNEHHTTDAATVDALLSVSEPVAPVDFREAVMEQNPSGFSYIGEDVINKLLADGKLDMVDVRAAIGDILKETT